MGRKHVTVMWRKFVAVWICGVALVGPMGAAATEEPSAGGQARSDPRAGFVALGAEPTTPQVCESPRCTAVDSKEACTACRFWNYAMMSFPEHSVAFDGRVIENGVVLTVTSREPRVQELLWTVSLARHRFVEVLRSGRPVPLCAPCQVNVATFLELELGTKRLPDGVLLTYTSSDPALVQLLQDMVVAGRDLPL